MKPVVKESEKSRILSTKDYSLFEFPDFKISKKHLQKIKDSILVKDLSKDYPIIVSDRSYRIIEGRYRFLACYELQLPIHYKIAEVTTEKDAIRIKHIHKNIALDDVVRVYADIKSYNDILILKDELNGEFSTEIIVMSIDEARHGKYKCIPKLDRMTIDSGALPVWNYNKTKARLLRIRNWHNRYADFGWSKKEAFNFVDDHIFTPNKNEEKALKIVDDYTKAYNAAYKEFHGNTSNLRTGIPRYETFLHIVMVLDDYDNELPMHEVVLGTLSKLGFDMSSIQVRTKQNWSSSRNIARQFMNR